MKSKTFKANKNTVPENWWKRIQNFLNISNLNINDNSYWVYESDLKKTNKINTRIKKPRYYSGIDDSHYPPQSIFLKLKKENEPCWILPIENYKKALSFYNKTYQTNLIEKLFNIKENELLTKISEQQSKFKIKSFLNQLKVNKNDKFLLTNENLLTILNLFNSLNSVFQIDLDNKEYDLNIKYWKFKNNFQNLIEMDDFESMYTIEKNQIITKIDPLYKRISFLRNIITHFPEYKKQKADINIYIHYKTIIFKNDFYIFFIKNEKELNVIKYNLNNIIEKIKQCLTIIINNPN